jgi:hypothetical protein
MTLILLEALLALLLLVGIVWWTMFSGRPKGELPQAASGTEPAAPAETGALASGGGQKPADPPQEQGKV